MHLEAGHTVAVEVGHMAPVEEHRMVEAEVEAGYMVDLEAGLRTAAEGIDPVEALHTAAAEVEDILAAEGMDYGKELRTVVAEVEGTLDYTGLGVGPAGADKLLAAHNPEEGLGSCRNRDEVGILAVDSLEAEAADMVAAGNLL